MARTDVINVGTNAADVRASVKLMPYSRVTVIVDEETEYTAGNDSGLTLEVGCPWGSQAMADNILTAVRGYQYQPYTATGAMVDPAAEIGDAVTVNSVYGGLYQQDINFGHLFVSDIAAPEDEQLDHEFKFETPIERRITRQGAWARSEFRITNAEIAAEVQARTADSSEFRASISAQATAITAEVRARQADSNEFRASISAQATEINARVKQTGGTNSSFGWSLISSAFKLFAGNKEVFKCDSGGVVIDGKITARSGYIGNGSSGFEIGNTYIRNNKNSPTDNKSGVYIGTNGIGVGNGVFSVDTSGNLTVKGKIQATSGYIGNGSSGFEIGNTYLRNGMTSLGDTSHDGVFIGTDGISLGRGNFKVDKYGNLTAKNGTFDGTVKAAKITGQIVATQIGNGAVEASKIQDGAVTSGKLQDGAVGSGKLQDGAVGSGKLGDGAVTNAKLGDGSVGTSKIGGGAVTKGKTSSAVQTSLDNGDTAKASFESLIAGRVTATRIQTQNLGVTNTLYLNDRGQTAVIWKNITDGNGNTQRVLSQR